MNSLFAQYPEFARLPLIAILRGITPQQVVPATEKLLELGYHFIEVPLNSPDAISSIRLLVEDFSDRACIGAGTVVTEKQLEDVLATGAKLIVTPNTNAQIIARAAQAGCVVLPGVQTLSEAFLALESGASGIKLFPCDSVPPATLKAMTSVLPEDTACFPVGGIDPDATQMKPYLKAGACGFGLGSGLYRTGNSICELEHSARAYVDAWHAATHEREE